MIVPHKLAIIAAPALIAFGVLPACSEDGAYMGVWESMRTEFPAGVDERVAARDAYWSLIRITPGTDPASGEIYDEYVMDYNLSLEDCVDAMHARRATKPVIAWACERQPQGKIAD